MSLFRLSSYFNYTHMARKRLGRQKRHRSLRKMKRLWQEKERMERKVERMRAKTKRLKKSKKRAEAKLRRILEQFEEVRIANLQGYQDNAFADAFVHINLAIFEAEEAGDFVTAVQLAQTLRDLMGDPMAHGDEEQQDTDDEEEEDDD